MKSTPEYILIPIDEIELLDDNPREISEKDFKQLCIDIKKDPNFLKQRPPLINFTKGKNICYAGYQRVTAARHNGEKEMWVWRERNVSKQLQDERMMKDNLHRGEWDFEKLKALDFNFDFLLDIGFNEKDLGSMFNSVEVPMEESFNLEETIEAIKKPLTKIGDIYELGNHRLICGDATDDESIKKLMAGQLAKLCTTDPPYNVDYQGGTKSKLKIQNDNMNGSDFFNLLLNSFQNIFNHMELGSMIYIFHADTEGINFRKAMIEAGFKLSQCCVWVKNAIVMGRQDYHWQHEPVLVGWKEGVKHRWYGGRNKSTVWNFNKPLRNEEHPTMKPIELINHTIVNSSNVGDGVLDLFGGSGTALISCEILKRKAFISELDPIYCDVIVSRYKKYCIENGKEIVIILNGKPLKI